MEDNMTKPRRTPPDRIPAPAVEVPCPDERPAIDPGNDLARLPVSVEQFLAELWRDSTSETDSPAREADAVEETGALQPVLADQMPEDAPSLIAEPDASPGCSL